MIKQLTKSNRIRLAIGIVLFIAGLLSLSGGIEDRLTAYPILFLGISISILEAKKIYFPNLENGITHSSVLFRIFMGIVFISIWSTSLLYSKTSLPVDIQYSDINECFLHSSEKNIHPYYIDKRLGKMYCGSNGDSYIISSVLEGYIFVGVILILLGLGRWHTLSSQKKKSN